jgi:hypothetical protein
MTKDASKTLNAIMAGTKTLSEQPLLGGLGSFMKSYNYSKNNYVEALYDTVLGVPSMFVPQLVRQGAQWRDNTMRETRAGDNTQRAFAQIATQIPFLSESFPPRFDIMGQAQERYQYGGNSLMNILLNPAMVTRVKKDPVLSEAQRLIDATGAEKIAPRSTERTADLNGKRYELTNEQISAYQFYVGNYTMARYNRYMASPRFARLPDATKVELLAKELTDVHAATKSLVLGGSAERLTRQQLSLRRLLQRSELGRTPPTGMPFQSYAVPQN